MPDINIKISQLNSAAQPLSGQETVVMNQNGNTVTAVLSSIKNYTNIGVGGGSDVSTLSGNWQSNYNTFNSLSSNYAVKNSNNNFTTGQSIFGGLSCVSMNLSGSLLHLKRGITTNSFGIISNGYSLSGSHVNALGSDACNSNTGSYVNAFGIACGYGNTGSTINALGFNAGGFNIGSNVNALGDACGFSNNGSHVNALGGDACGDNSGSYVNALGYSACNGNIGSYVNAFGYSAGYGNSGSYINAFGSDACNFNSGSYVNALGYGAGYNNTGSYVNAFGENTGFENTGSYVNAFGSSAGYGNTGSYNQFFGRNTTTSPTSLSGCLVVGDSAVATQHNTIALGSTIVPFLTSGSGTATGNYLVIRLNGTNLKIPLYS